MLNDDIIAASRNPRQHARGMTSEKRSILKRSHGIVAISSLCSAGFHVFNSCPIFRNRQSLGNEKSNESNDVRILLGKTSLCRQVCLLCEC